MSDYGQALLLTQLQRQMAPVSGRWFNKYGANADVDTGSTPELVWTPGGQYDWPSTATAMEIVSTSTGDRSASTGAHTVFVQGLGSSAGDTQSETVTLNGQAPVALANKYYRVNRMYLKSAGTNEVNIGTISVRTLSSNTTHCNIIPTIGQTLIGIWTVPGGKCARVRRVWAHFPMIGARSNATLDLHFRTGGVELTKHRFALNTVIPEYKFEWPIGGPVAEALTDIYIEVMTVASNDTAIEAGFDVSIEDAATGD